MPKCLVCPHGKELSITLEKGMVVYRHQEDQTYCPVLNTFATTPQDVLTVTITSILTKKEYAGWLRLDQTLPELIQAWQELNSLENRFTEFTLFFKRSEAVRELVYGEIGRLSRPDAAGEWQQARKLLTLVLYIFLEGRLQQEERVYKKCLAEFFLCFGLQFPRLAGALAICKPTGSLADGRVEALQREMAFHKKYVFPTRKEDKYALGAWLS